MRKSTMEYAVTVGMNPTRLQRKASASTAWKPSCFTKKR